MKSMSVHSGGSLTGRDVRPWARSEPDQVQRCTRGGVPTNVASRLTRARLRGWHGTWLRRISRYVMALGLSRRRKSLASCKLYFTYVHGLINRRSDLWVG